MYKGKTGIQKLMDERVKRREERKIKESRNSRKDKPRSPNVNNARLKAKHLPYGELDGLSEESKALRTYYEDPRKAKGFNIRIKRGSRDHHKGMTTKPLQISKASFFKCQF